MFKAILIRHDNDHYSAELTDVCAADLPAGEVTVQVDYSSINYKDAMAITGRGPIVRSFPMVPGIDLAGNVLASSNPAYRAGDKVLLTGWGVGERHWGGLAQQARVKSEWLTPIPEGADSHQVMAIGTAGFTAMLCVDALLGHGVKPADGPVLVTGASGGVGSCAVAILSGLGYQVSASTGRPERSGALLQALGAAELVDRETLSQPGKPLQKERWAAVIDTVGSHTLMNACATTRYAGIVAACGMAQGLDFPASVAPFILRGITLRGIDSVMVPAGLRAAIWQKASQHLTRDVLEKLTKTVPLDKAVAAASRLLDGQSHGRIVVDCR
ncbi:MULTISPECIES: MDR family oxidoreductase [unclassified Erwinia]|uniref:acrylyl-CoA reductase (NADPH) n=1 Tax=unclassified Erwinia TaxID=2622719 RepID=UPI0006F6CEE8|nr:MULTISPECIES: MDR family oxidoreductase [unclassified Erwinia]KQN55534.1 hypothetical protein ASF13_08480 [Erwinia sp. Leaf53]PLV63818.1 hypothetical protein NV64_00900 [Erwinia sp. B116]